MRLKTRLDKLEKKAKPKEKIIIRVMYRACPVTGQPARETGQIIFFPDGTQQFIESEKR